MNQNKLSEEDFKVQGHCCAITIPAIKTLEDDIDFSSDEKAKLYLAQHYGISKNENATPSQTITGKPSIPT
ncbi:MAG: hypothetical protein U1E94_01425 [Agitococcus sp.]